MKSYNRFTKTAAPLLACLGLLGSQALAQGVAGGMSTRRMGDLPPAERLRATLVSLGSPVCTNAIVTAAAYLFEDGEGDFTVQPLGPDSNRWPIVVTLESFHAQSGSSRLSVITIANSGSCSGNYQQTITWPQSCQVVRSTIFAKYGANRALFRSVQVSELTPAIQLYMMASGSGCVTIKKELIA